MLHTERNEDEMANVLSAQEASEILGLSVKHIIRLAREGKITAKLLGKQWAISRASVLAEKARRKAELDEE